MGLENSTTTDPLHPAAVARRVDRWASEGPQGPLTLEIYPTLRCNLDCAFCDTTDRHRPPVDELPDDRWLGILDEAAALGVARVMVLGGGEPLARRELVEPLVRAVKAHGMEGLLTTNGTLLGERTARALVEAAWDEVHVSIDGPDAGVHDPLRGRPGSFRRAVTNACRLRVLRERAGARVPRLALHFVLTRANWRTLPDMVRLARALGAFRVDFDALIAYTPEQGALRLDAGERSQVARVAAEARRLAREHGIATTLDHLTEPERLDRGNTAPEPDAGATGLARAPCLRAWHHLVVQADGRTSPCCVLAGLGESVAARPLAQVWTEGAFLRSVRETMARGVPLARCRECSWNILGHEALVRAHLRALGGGP